MYRQRRRSTSTFAGNSAETWFLRRESPCLAMGLAPAGLRAALAREFDRRFPLPERLARLGCLELVAAFVNYPLDVVKEERGQP